MIIIQTIFFVLVLLVLAYTAQGFRLANKAGYEDHASLWGLAFWVVSCLAVGALLLFGPGV